MAKQTRDYTNLRETERVYEAVALNGTYLKDYALRHLVFVTWRINDHDDKHHLNRLTIGRKTFIGRTTDLSRAVHALVERQDENDWLPRDVVRVPSYDEASLPLDIDTRGVNGECLRDHVARVNIGREVALLDLEELLKAIRYA